MDRAAADEAMRHGDLDELLRVIDGCCEHGDWGALTRVHDACERAHETGRQLWPAASHAAYRLALDAPAPFAARVLIDGQGRFAPGPLAEVAAQRHTWDELAPHLTAGTVATLTAHERVVRGEDVESRSPPGPSVLEVPWTLEDWEPAYPLAEYHSHGAEFPAPEMPTLVPLELPRRSTRSDDDDVTTALADVARAWATESNGRIEVAAVRGDAHDAIAAFGPRSARVAAVPAPVALAHVAWAGASGGAHGRRRGAAAGRFGVWWLAGALAGALDEWRPSGTRLAATVAAHRWHLWDAAEPPIGWHLRIAIDDDDGHAWALAATDAT